MAAFKVSFSIRKEFQKKKKKLMERLHFALISLFHVQIQEPSSSSTTTRAFAFLAKFIIAKYLKLKVDHDLSICMDEDSPNVTWSKGNDVITLNREVPYGLLSRGSFYCPNLITVTLQLDIKTFFNITWLWGNDISTSYIVQTALLQWRGLTWLPLIWQ